MRFSLNRKESAAFGLGVLAYLTVLYASNYIGFNLLLVAIAPASILGMVSEVLPQGIWQIVAGTMIALIQGLIYTVLYRLYRAINARN